MKLLPVERWAKYLRNQPETGMGYWTADVTTSNGQTFKDVIINDGYITKIRGRPDIPFEASDIAKIKVTGKKWNWTE